MDQIGPSRPFQADCEIRRRRFLCGSSVAMLLGGFSQPVLGGCTSTSPEQPLPVAALITAYYPVSHADVIVSKILEGYQRNNAEPRCGLKLVSMMIEQSHQHDIGQAMAARHGVRLCQTVDEAITLGTGMVQVAGVLSIAEHGDYPKTPLTKQKMYPRRRFFDETVATFTRCQATVPFFNDKHLSYRWDDALAMATTAREMRFPMLAGSSLPVTWRFPALEMPRDCEIEAALTIGYGPLEDYGFHALEAHQCMIERRRGGESGVRAVEVVIDQMMLARQRAGGWSKELFAAARQAMPGNPMDADRWDPATTDAVDALHRPAAYLMTHHDGLQSAVIMTGEFAGGFAFACKLKGRSEPLACWFKLQDCGYFGHFSYLLEAFEATIRQQQAVYPIERTLLTTGVLDRCMNLVATGGGRVLTPELEISYQPSHWTFANHPQSRLQLPHD